MNRTSRALIAALLVVLGCFCGATVAQAAVTFTLFDAANPNSTATFNDSASPNGLVDWQINGVDQLFQQWNWFRIGSTGGESQLQTLGAGVLTSTGTTNASVTYTSAALGLVVKVSYDLSANALGSPNAAIKETTTITNIGASAINLHWFQYADIDLGGPLSAGDDFLYFPSGTIADQYDSGTEFSETTQGGAPNFYQGALFNALLTALNDGNPTTLNDTPALGLANQIFGDVTWAFQWDFLNLQPGIANQIQFTTEKELRLARSGETGPEASSLVIWGVLGLAASGRMLTRRNRKPA